MDPAIIAGGIKAISGLFGKKQRFVPPSEMITSAAEGARTGAEKFGFNALTLLGLGAQSGMTPGSPPPLASLSVLGDMIEEKYGQDAKDRREYNRLQNELLSLEVDRARTLNVVAPVATVSGGGAITGGFGNARVSGPAKGFLTETDRNPPMADERDATVSYQSHGQETVLGLGPDWDELVTGWLIDTNNRRKARLAEEAAKPPRGIVPELSPEELAKGKARLMGFGMPPDVYDPTKSLGPKGWKKPKPNPNRKNLPQKRWEQKFTF